MRLDEFRPDLEAFWERVLRDADRVKDPQQALNELERAYRSLDEGERELALAVFTDWVLGPDTRRNFAGLAMIDKFSIQGALPALRQLASSLENATGPSAPYDWAMVNGIIGRLTSAHSDTQG